MGLSLRSLGRSIVDLFDGDDEKDRQAQVPAALRGTRTEQAIRAGTLRTRAPQTMGGQVSRATFARANTNPVKTYLREFANPFSPLSRDFRNTAVDLGREITTRPAARIYNTARQFYINQGGTRGERVSRTAPITPMSGDDLAAKTSRFLLGNQPLSTVQKDVEDIARAPVINKVPGLKAVSRSPAAPFVGLLLNMPGTNSAKSAGKSLTRSTVRKALQSGDEIAPKLLSKEASNSLENAAQGVKPGALKRASIELENGVSQPVRVRTVERGKLIIEDGRHRLEAARRLGIPSFPVEDVTKNYSNLRGVALQSRLSKLNSKLNEGGYIRLPGRGQPKLQPGALRKSFDSSETTIPPRKPQVSIKSTGLEPMPQVKVKQAGLGTQAKTAFIEKDAPIVRTLRQVEKQTGKKGVVDQFMYDSGLQSRSASIANQKLASNPNLKNALKGLKKSELDELNAYSAARSEKFNASRGMQTSAPVEDLDNVVRNLEGKYGGRFESLNKFYKDLAKDLRDGGVIDEARYQQFISSPDYVRIQRDMSDLVNVRGKGGNAYSLGSTITSKRRVGSRRAIEGADTTAFEYTQQVQKEIQRNQTARNLVNTLNESGLAKELDPSRATMKNTVKFLDNGRVRVFEVSPDLKEVIDNVAPYQLNTLEKIVAYPKRIFQAGTTGLSVPFTVANWVKDQVGSAINSKSLNFIATTHSPQNIMNGLWQSSKAFAKANNDPLWQKFIAHAGDTTQFDLLRNVSNAKAMSRQLRRGEAGFIANKATSWVKSLEDFVSITEKATRFQNFKGVYQKALKATGNESDALREATLAAWQNSVDFNRYGNWGKTLNLLIPYFNSGIQGSRQLVRSFKNRPIATSIKSVATVGIPIAGVTAWNLQDPERKAVYDNISEFEKENNLIIVPPGPLSQNKDGTYNVWKIPLVQGFGKLFGGTRRAMESYANKEPNDFLAISEDILQAVTGPVDPDFRNPKKMGSSLIPQAVKPLVQQLANEDLFTGKDIVPDYIEGATDAQGNPIPESKKALDYTSGSARILGGILDKSPIRIEKFFKDTFGKIGQYGENTVDNVLAKLGIIPQEQIGGTSPREDLTRRFTKAQSEYNFQKSEGAKYFDDRKAATASLNANERAAYDALHPSKTNFLGEDILDENKRITNYTKAGIYLQFPKVFEADRAIDAAQRAKGKPGNPIYDLAPEQLTRVLLKSALPPGAEDPELSNLWQQEWYQDFSNKRSLYYDQIKQSLAKEGKSLPQSDYPQTPPQLQKVMDQYSALPKGTGERSAWIRANPDLWQQMTNQWSAVDAWENKERVKIGLSPIQKEEQSGFGYGSGGRGSSEIVPEQYAVSPTAAGRISVPKVSYKQPTKLKLAANSGGKPKVSLKKSKV